ncbi:MAG: hypothetical protein ACRD3B_09930, partial [Candidatus Sulfotelmatobacter sp.]
MFEPNSLLWKATRRFFPPGSGKQEQQRRLMAVALTLLAAALVFVLYQNRDFWFPDTQDAEDEVLQSAPAAAASSPAGATKQTSRRKASGKPQLTASAEPVSSVPPIVATATRTVLPPLEVEVVAGDTHRKLPPASNAVE